MRHRDVSGPIAPPIRLSTRQNQDSGIDGPRVVREWATGVAASASRRLQRRLHDTPADASPHLAFLAEKIVANVNASQVVGVIVQLRRQGNEWVGRSPFTNTTMLDFYVNDDEGWYFCLATRRKGDIVRFVMETQGKNFTETVTYLAGFLGVRQPL